MINDIDTIAMSPVLSSINWFKWCHIRAICTSFHISTHRFNAIYKTRKVPTLELFTLWMMCPWQALLLGKSSLLLLKLNSGCIGGSLFYLLLNSTSTSPFLGLTHHCHLWCTILMSTWSFISFLLVYFSLGKKMLGCIDDISWRFIEGEKNRKILAKFHR